MSAHIESNIVYGMVSGLALLLDVYRPETPNGYGIVHISGSGWSAPLSLDARPLKEGAHARVYGIPLAEAGYTVFTINHRATPRFHYPAPVEDAQRAVRFVRHEDYGIDPDRIGAIGGSSGGHLVSMLGLLNGKGDPEDESPVNRESAGVQCVVARAAPSDFLTAEIRPNRALFLGASSNLDTPGSTEHRRAVEASPISHITPNAPPFLLIHGTADPVVPFELSERFYEALQKAGVTTDLLPIPGGGHGATFGNVENSPDYVGAAIRWFDTHLKKA